MRKYLGITRRILILGYNIIILGQNYYYLTLTLNVTSNYNKIKVAVLELIFTLKMRVETHF